jgi:probable HAF family extracellular repeat protein
MLAYTITTLYGPQGAYGAVAEGINNLGEVVGWYKDPGGVSNPLHGFTYSSGSYTPVNTDDPNGWNTILLDINDAGEVVGNYNDGGAAFAGNNQLSAPNSVETAPFGINNTGEVVGFYYDSSLKRHGFLYNGGFTTLDDPNADETFPERINNNGQIVGAYTSGGQAFGFLYSGGTFTTLGFLPVGITDSEEMVRLLRRRAFDRPLYSLLRRSCNKHLNTSGITDHGHK